MAELLSAAPGLAGAGFGGLLLLLVVYLLKWEREGRIQHRETVAALKTEHRDEGKSLESKIDRLEARIDELQKVIDAERSLRRDAQDQAARAEARAAAAESHAAALRQLMGAGHDPASTWLPPSPELPARPVDPGDGLGQWWRDSGDAPGDR